MNGRDFMEKEETFLIVHKEKYAKGDSFCFAELDEDESGNRVHGLTDCAHATRFPLEKLAKEELNGSAFRFEGPENYEVRRFYIKVFAHEII